MSLGDGPRDLAQRVKPLWQLAWMAACAAMTV